MSGPSGDLPPLDRAARRRAVLERLGHGLAVLRAPPLRLHAGDVEARYRPDSDFFYLTGFPEPDAVAVLDGSADRERFLLFVPPRDAERETWTGRRAGVEGARERYGADAAFPIGELSQRLLPLIARSGPLHTRLGADEAFDHRLLDLAREAWASRPRMAEGERSVRDLGAILDDLRLRKSPEELAWMRRAISISADAHREAIRAVRPGMHEYEIEALLEYEFRRRGAAGWAYPSIVAGGENATVLHYTSNDARLRDGDLLLVDAGAEIGCYCADLTRTFPVGDGFRPAQRRTHDLVHRAHAAGVAAVRPGATVEDVHRAALEVLVEGLLDLGLLAGEARKILEEGSYRRFYMHRTSHWLGMNVHDVGAYVSGGGPRVLEPGMVLTVEPGLYFAPGLEGVPPEYRGIGVRIEDDVLVTAEGCEVLSADLPRGAEEMLALRGG